MNKVFATWQHIKRVEKVKSLGVKKLRKFRELRRFSILNSEATKHF